MRLRLGSRARGAAQQTAAQLVVALSGYLTAVILARALGPAAFGAYGIVYSVLLSVEIVGRLGLPQAVTKLVAERDISARAATEATGTTLAAIGYLALFVAFVAASPWMGEVLNVPDGARLFRIAALDIPFYGLFLVAHAVLTGRGNYAAAAGITVVYAAAKALGILAMTVIGITIEVALYVNAAGSAVGLVAALAATGARTWLPTLGSARPILRLAVPVSMRGVASQILGNVGLWAIGIAAALMPPDAAGLYAAAGSVARLPVILALAMTGITTAGVAAACARGDREGARAVLAGASRGLLVLLLPASLFVAVDAPALMTLFFAGSYAEGGPLLAILVLGRGLAFSYLLVLTSALIGASQARAAAVASWGGVIFATAAAVALIPWLGATGAAWATTLGCAAAAWTAGVLCHRHIGPFLSLRETGTTLLATAPVIALAALLPAMHGPAHLLALVALGALQLLLLALAGLVRPSDLRDLLRPAPKRAES